MPSLHQQHHHNYDPHDRRHNHHLQHQRNQSLPQRKPSQPLPTPFPPSPLPPPSHTTSTGSTTPTNNLLPSGSPHLPPCLPSAGVSPHAWRPMHVCPTTVSTWDFQRSWGGLAGGGEEWQMYNEISTGPCRSSVFLGGLPMYNKMSTGPCPISGFGGWQMYNKISTGPCPIRVANVQ